MSLYCLSILKQTDYNNSAIFLYQEYDVSSFNFLTRHYALEIFNFLSRSLCDSKNTKEDKHILVHNQYVFHVLKVVDIVAVVVTSSDYLDGIAFSLAKKTIYQLLDEYPKVISLTTVDTYIKSDSIKQLFILYKNQLQASKIHKIQHNLDETLSITTNLLEKILERGQKLDDLVEQSNDLSNSTRVFYKKTKELNRCCILM